MKYFLLLGLLLLASCATTPSGNLSDRTISKETPAELTLFTVRDRQAEFDVCGCSARPLGGMGREKNLLDLWRKQNPKNAYHVSFGQTFIPLPSQWKDGDENQFFEKGKFMVEGLNELKSAALFLGINDTALGIDRLKSLSRLADFPFVSASIYSTDTNKPVFAPFLEWEVNGKKVLLTSVSQYVTDSKWRLDAKTKLVSVVEALKPVLEKTPKPEFVILFSDLPSGTNEELIALYPQIRVVVGNAKLTENSDIVQKGSNAIATNQLQRGRDLGLLKVQIGGMKEPFFNAEIGRQMEKEIAWRQIRLKKINARVAKEKKKPAKDQLKLVAMVLKLEIEDLSLIPFSAAPHQLTYEFSAKELTPDLDQPPNSLHKMLEKYKVSVRQRVINEDTSVTQSGN